MKEAASAVDGALGSADGLSYRLRVGPDRRERTTVVVRS
jgi:hypothetical protein